MSDDLNARDRHCLEQCSIISNQFRELVVRVNAIDAPTKKKQRQSKNNSVRASSRQQSVESVKADCKDLNDTILGVLKELRELVGEEEAAGPSGQPAAGGNR